jgi:hypothetical protein
VALALASRFSLMLSFQIKEMEFTGMQLSDCNFTLGFAFGGAVVTASAFHL